MPSSVNHRFAGNDLDAIASVAAQAAMTFGEIDNEMFVALDSRSGPCSPVHIEIEPICLKKAKISQAANTAWLVDLHEKSPSCIGVSPYSDKSVGGTPLRKLPDTEISEVRKVSPMDSFHYPRLNPLMTCRKSTTHTGTFSLVPIKTRKWQVSLPCHYLPNGQPILGSAETSSRQTLAFCRSSPRKNDRRDNLQHPRKGHGCCARGSYRSGY